MMRKPTPARALYAYHRAALAGEKPGLHEGADGIPEDEHGNWPCGWYRARHVRRAPFVPARVYVLAQIDPVTKELVADEELRCEVDGVQRDPAREIGWLVQDPIKHSEFEYMTALRRWQRVNAPEEYAAAWHPIDNLSTPIPE